MSMMRINTTSQQTSIQLLKFIRSLAHGDNLSRTNKRNYKAIDELKHN